MIKEQLSRYEQEQIDYLIANIPDRIRQYIDCHEMANAYAWQIVLDLANDIDADGDVDFDVMKKVVSVGRQLQA